MIILGIDTSCDDTSAGAVEDGQRVLSNVVHSQVALHHPHGGVVPELASREHLKNIIPVVSEALARAESIAGDRDKMESHLKEARSACDRIADEDSKKMLLDDLNSIK